MEQNVSRSGSSAAQQGPWHDETRRRLEAEVVEAANELQSADKLKVIELSKKARSLNLELGRERQKVAQLQQKLSEVTAESAKAESKPGSEEVAEDARARGLALCKERVQQMTNRMGHLEQKVFLLEGENKRLVRALVCEVGEDVPLAEVLEGGGGWKGRQQQITHLKDVIRQLREAAGVGPATSSKAESAHRSVIGKLSRERMDATARLEGELAAAQAAAEQLRLQSTGASSRCKVLEAEIATLRGKLTVVLQKTESDDKLLAALTSRLSRLEAAGAGANTVQPNPLQWRIASNSQAAQQHHRQAAAAADYEGA